MPQQQQERSSKYPQNYNDGLYKVVVLGQTLGESEQKKTPLLALKVEVRSLVKTKDGRPYNPVLGGHRTVKIWLTPGTKDRVKKFLTDAGFYPKAQSLKQLSPNDPHHVSLVGYEFTATNSPEASNKDGKLWDRFEPLISTKDPNEWMQKLGTANTGKIHGLDAIFGSAPGAMVERVREAVHGDDRFYDQTAPKGEPAPFAPADDDYTW